MRVGHSTLGALSDAWRNTHHTSAAAEHCAPAADDSGQHDLVLPATAGKDHAELGLQGGSPTEPPSPGNLPRELASMIASHLPDRDIGRLSQVNRHLHEALAQEREASRLLARAQRATQLTEFQALLGAPRAGMEPIRDLARSLQERLLELLNGRIPALPICSRELAHRLVQNAETLLRMAPDVRRHYADTGWIDQLAIVPDPEGTSVVFGRAVSGAIVVDAQPEYWTGSVQFGSAGNRNVLLEPVDAGGARRWYLVGGNGERLSQYLDRRYGGLLTPGSAPFA